MLQIDCEAVFRVGIEDNSDSRQTKHNIMALSAQGSD